MSIYSHPTQYSVKDFSFPVEKSQSLLDTEFNLESFLDSLKISAYRSMNGNERKSHLKTIDGFGLFKAARLLYRRLAMNKLENYYLLEFLADSDPKALEGVDSRRKSRRETIVITPEKSTSTTSTSVHLRRHLESYKINYKTKIRMVEKSISILEKEIIIERKSGHQELKKLCAEVENLRMMCNEIKNTNKNFYEHFLENENDIQSLSRLSEKQLSVELHKFVNSWLKSAGSLLGLMHLSSISLHNKYIMQRNHLDAKKQLNSFVTIVDFDKIYIKKKQLQAELDDVMSQLSHLHNVSGRTAMSMNEEKQKMVNIEKITKKTMHSIEETLKTNEKLKKEMKFVESQILKSRKDFRSFKIHAEQYKAPSVRSYVKAKNKLYLMVKEAKILKRKYSIISVNKQVAINKLKNLTNQN